MEENGSKSVLVNLFERNWRSNCLCDWGKLWPNITSYRLDKWGLATLNDLISLVWIGASKDQIWLLRLDELFMQCWNQLPTWHNNIFMQIGDQYWPDMTCYRLDKLFWEMLDPTPNGQYFMCIGTHNGQKLENYFSAIIEWWIMTYDFLEDKWVL